MSWRAIQDTVAASESLAAVSHGAERLYWRLLSESDSYGRLRGEPMKVRATCMPLLDVDENAIIKWLLELQDVKRIIHYEIEGRQYVQISDFDSNQPTEFLRKRGKERYPAPPRAPQCGLRPPYSGPRAPQNETSSFAGNSGHGTENSGTSPAQDGVEENVVEVEKVLGNGSTSTEDQEDLLPISNLEPAAQLEITKIVACTVGKDDRSDEVIRNYAGRLPLGSLVKVRESCRGKPARYVVGALKSELQELEERRNGT